METDEKDEKEGAEASKDGEEAGKPKAPEALSYKLDNPSRVTPAQQKFVAHDEASRWRPIHPGRQVTGIIVFKDLQPGAHGFLKGKVHAGPFVPQMHRSPSLRRLLGLSVLYLAAQALVKEA